MSGQSRLAPNVHAAMRADASVAGGSIEVRLGNVHERVAALRDDVLRITVWRGNTAPEDASWAVPAPVRHSSVPVTQSRGKDHTTLRTPILNVDIDAKTLKITIRDQNGAIVQQDARPVRFDGDSFRIYKSMPLDEHYFGLGDKTGPLDRRDQSFSLWNTDAYRFQETTDPIYKSIPFFMTYRAGRAMGVLLDNTWRTSFDFGKELPDAYSFGSVGGPADYYVLYGPAAKDVVRAYAWLTGTPPLPPLWAFGFQQSRYSYMTQDRVLEVANKLREDRIPSDAIYLDIDFQEKNRPFTVNTAAFPDLPGMIEELHKKNFHVVAITDLHIANAPNQNYHPFDSGVAGDHFVKDANGSIYTGIVWPGPSVFPDFMRQQTREWWGSLYKDLRNTGVDGFWNDMNEPSVFSTPNHTMPETALHRIDEPGFASRTATHAEVHDVYGMQNCRATFDGLKAIDPGLRPFVLTRAAYAGTQRYAVTWTGDNSSTWNHLRLATPMIENLGLSGFAFTGADVGGYAGTPSIELLTKWFEVGAFQPIDRDHAEKGKGDQEPWIGGPEQEAIRRRFVEARYGLLPYIYTLAEEASRTGVSMVRPLFLEFPDATPDRHPIDIDTPASSEFMLGPGLLIAPRPFPDEQGPYDIELPPGGWYDYWTGEKIPEPAARKPIANDPAALLAASAMNLSIVPELGKLPVFVRAGSILPIAPVVQSTGITPSGPLTLRVYPGKQCRGELYQDDGKTYEYQQGAYLRMRFECTETSYGIALTIGPREGSYAAWWKQLRVEIYGWTSAQATVTMDGRQIEVDSDAQRHQLVFNLEDKGKAVSLLFRSR
jgi:alpha-glucosidase